MLEKLFGSQTRVKLLRVFLGSGEKKFYIRELTRLIKERLNSVRRELLNLENFGLIKSADTSQKKYYFLADDFVLLNEMKALFFKARMLMEKKLVSKIESLRGLKYLALSGIFVKDDDQEVDMLIVGDLSRIKLAKMIKSLEKNFDQEFRYTYLTMAEFKFRKEITDKFLYQILNGKKIIVVNKLKNV